MVRTRILLFLVSLILVPSVTYFVILFARGYRVNVTRSGIDQTGILAATSLPDGSQLIINGELKSATNTSVNLEPGEYVVEIKKEGFQTWKKKLQIEAGIVTRASATLFPNVPSLRAVTSTGAQTPTLSWDGTRVAFTNQSKLFTLDLSESPLGLVNRDPRLISDFKFLISNFELIWSPDSKQILAMATPSSYLIDAFSSQSFPQIASAASLLKTWNLSQELKDGQKFTGLPLSLQNILATTAAEFVWSPKENKIMYTATASAQIPDRLIRKLPGSSSQAQSRTIVVGKKYVYDLEEDRNFEINAQCSNLKPLWFPDSTHLICSQKGKVTIVEYDGQNPTTVYEGPMEDSYAFPYPSGKQVVILTNLNPNSSLVPNLYAVSLR